MQWVIEGPDRFLDEREALDDLAASVDWMTSKTWGFTNTALLKVDIDLVVGGKTREVELVYRPARWLSW